jgi:hypothetical protein
MRPNVFTGLLRAFSLLYEFEIASLGDHAALDQLLTLLKRQDPFILLTKDGPAVHALLSWFGLIPPHGGQARLDVLDPELVCRVLVEFEKYKLALAELDGARDILARGPLSYADRRP